MGWVPQEVTVTLHDDPVRYTLVTGGGVPAGTKDLMDLLDRLGVPKDAGVRAAGTAIRESGRKVQAAVVRAAVKCRREGSLTLVEPVDNLGKSVPDTLRHDSGQSDPARVPEQSGTPDKTPASWTGTPSGTLRHADLSKRGVPPLRSSGTPQDRAETDDSEPVLEGLF